MRYISLIVGMLFAAPLIADSEYDFQVANGKPIEFVPFKVEDFCKRYTDSKCTEYYIAYNEVFHDREKFVGTIGQYVDYLNSMEKVYNQGGQTLRVTDESNDADTIHPMEVPTDKTELKKNVLESLHLQTKEFLAKVVDLDPVLDCPTLPMPGKEFRNSSGEYPKLSIGRFTEMPLDDIVRRINEGQRVLCSLGINLFEDLDLSSFDRLEQALKEILAKLDRLLESSGIFGDSTVFSGEAVEAISTAIDIAKDIADRIQNKKVPGPEQLFELGKTLSQQLPQNIYFPDVPNFPAPTPPTRRELTIKKRKDWAGFNHGNRGRFATYANAYLQLSGSEEAQEGTAFGAAGVYILNRELNVIGGYGMAYAGPDEVSLRFELKAFGQHVFEPVDYKHKVEIVKKEPKAWGFEYAPEYSQTFMAGPIPVTVSVGARIDIALGYDYGIYTTLVKASLIPKASAVATATAKVGIPAILAIGAEGVITIIDASLPIVGYAGVNFDEVGYPFLKLSIETYLEYSLLNGRVYAFAEYLVPKWGLPPWKKKRAEKDIFTWKGVGGKIMVMNWGLELGRNGTKLRGDLLDQTDRQEAQELQNAISLEQRKAAVHELNIATREKVHAIFAGITKDLSTSDNGKVAAFRDYIPQLVDQSFSTLDSYSESIGKLLEQRLNEAS